jgi:hypothetical protein
VSEEVLQVDEVEELPGIGQDDEVVATRPLPVERTGGEMELSSDVRNAALAAAGGLVAGVATVAAVRVARSVASPKRSRSKRGIVRREQPANILASRSFLVDVHLLGR